MQHITVYHEPGRYAGWPANGGIWSWGDEIVVVFSLGYHDPAGAFHAIDRTRPSTAAQARSRDGGLTWQLEPPPYQRPADVEAIPPCPGGINFTHPDFALLCARNGKEAGARSWFYVSYDRCHTWQGPYSLPMFGQTGVAARTDYIVSGRDECTLFLTAAKSDGKEGRVFCARTSDGGKTFYFLSPIGPEPAGFSIMPASLRLSESRILCAVRCCERPSEFTTSRHWIDLYASDDNAATWQYLNRPVPDTGSGGNPPTLTRLHDGRLCLIYGYRARPFGIRARLSADQGATWSEEIVLRDDAGSHDLGYPRTVLRPDGTVVTVYYYNDRLGGEGYIAATLWKP